MLLKIKPFVMKALEDMRRTKAIGSPLEAKLIFETVTNSDRYYLSHLVVDRPDKG